MIIIPIKGEKTMKKMREGVECAYVSASIRKLRLWPPRKRLNGTLLPPVYVHIFIGLNNNTLTNTVACALENELEIMFVCMFYHVR